MGGGGFRRAVRRGPNRPGYGYVRDTVGKFQVGGVRMFWRGVREKEGSDEPPLVTGLYRYLFQYDQLAHTRRVPVEKKSSSMGLICMKYRIIILNIIIISLGQILLSYIANTSRTHACARPHACASTNTHTVAAVQVSDIRWRPTVMARNAGIHSR